MSNDELVLEVARILNRHGVAYVVVGSNAANLYRYPRSTVDLDLVLESLDTAAQLLQQHLNLPVRLDRQYRFENVTGARFLRLEFADRAFYIDLFERKDGAYDEERFARRRNATLNDVAVPVLTLEDIVLSKARWITRAKRPKDIDDLMHIIGAQEAIIDWAYVERWAEQLGIRTELQQMRKQAKEYSG